MKWKLFGAILFSILLSTELTLARPNCASTHLSQGLIAKIKSTLSRTRSEHVPRALSEISKEEFLEVKEITDRILTKFPPDQNVYLGVGRSPAPFMAFFRAIGIESLFGLPITAMKSHPDASDWIPWKMMQGFHGALSPKIEKELFLHFDKYLPDAQQLNGRNLVLLDYAYTGVSLAGIRAYIQKYYSQKNVQVNLIAVAVTRARASEELAFAVADIYPIKLRNGDLAKSFYAHLYDDYSPYGWFLVGRHPVESETRPLRDEFQNLVEEFAKRNQSSP